MIICAVIPTFNRVRYLRILLQQLSEQENSFNYTIIPIVVIDGSTDGTYEMITSEFPETLILKGPGNWWWTKSLNEGIKFSLSKLSPDYFLFLNDDSQVEKDYLHTIINAYNTAGENCIIGSISITDKQPLRVSFSGVKEMNWIILKKKNYYKSFELLNNISEKGLFPTYALNGRGTFLSSSLIKELNFLDENTFPQYGSDDDLALRAWKMGYKVLISFSSRVIDRTVDTSKGTAFRQDGVFVFLNSFLKWNSVNHIPTQLKFLYRHGIKILLPFYLLKFLLGTSYAYLFKYKKIKI